MLHVGQVTQQEKNQVKTEAMEEMLEAFKDATTTESGVTGFEEMQASVNFVLIQAHGNPQCYCTGHHQI